MKIIAIDDRPDMRGLYGTMFDMKKWISFILKNPDQLKDVPYKESIGIIVSDCEMDKKPDEAQTLPNDLYYSHRDTIRVMAQYFPNTPSLFVSGNYDITFKLNQEGFYTLNKPFVPSELFDCIDAILQ